MKVKDQKNQRSLRKPKIVETNLNRENLFARMDTDTNLIEIHKTLKGKTRFRKLIHELVHVAFPTISEKEVLHAEKVIGNALWEQGYRWVDNKKK